MSDQYLVRHCAPTLAGLKTGSLFTCPYGSREELFRSIRRMNQRLLPKGLRVLPLRCSEHKALIYIYRPRSLPGIWPIQPRLRFYGSMATTAEPANGASCGWSIGFGSRRIFPMRLDCFWGIRRRMCAGLSRTGPATASASAAGRSMGTKKPPKRNLPSIKSVREFTGING